MCRVLVPILLFALAQSSAPTPWAPPPTGPKEWVAFSSDVRINIPERAEDRGHYVQDAAESAYRRLASTNRSRCR
jgi:hypothetical protein